MANPRQRRKARSSSYKPISHSKNAKRSLKKMPRTFTMVKELGTIVNYFAAIRGPQILQDSWDKTKTVRQNYVALGLVHDLNPTAPGGSEPLENAYRSQHSEESQIASTSQLEEPVKPIRNGFGRIIRDDAGNVLRIELPEEDNETQTEKRQDEALPEPEVDGTVLGHWVTDLGGGAKIKLSSGDINVAQEWAEFARLGREMDMSFFCFLVSSHHTYASVHLDDKLLTHSESQLGSNKMAGRFKLHKGAGMDHDMLQAEKLDIFNDL
ncbi:hypothetical protein H0H93_015082 [Arthromyces matolae]|nr:hypothetical protein H0H93_015082 [Arthromyces matolae]